MYVYILCFDLFIQLYRYIYIYVPIFQLEPAREAEAALAGTKKESHI